MLHLFAVRLHPSLGVQLVFAGFGGILGYIAVSWAFYFLVEYANLRVVQASLGLVALCLLATAICVFIDSRSVKNKLMAVLGGEISKEIWFLLALIASLYFTVYTLIHLNLPAQGWDVLDHWGAEGVRFLEHAEEAEGGSFHYENRHPLTVPLILAWSSSGFFEEAGSKNSWSVWSFPWLMMTLSAAAVTAGWICWFSKSTKYAVVAALLIWTIPLFETQFLVSGYADLVLAIVLLSVIVILSVAISEEDMRLAMVGIGFLIFPVLLKNIGIAHAAIVASIFIISWKGRCHSELRLTVMVVASAFVIFAATGALRIETGLFPAIAYIPEGDRVIFGGYSMKVVLPNLHDLLSVELHSKILNMTFSVCLVIVLLSALLPSDLAETVQARPRALKIILYFVLLELALLFFSNFLDRGLRYAMPGSDTGYSRFSLPVFISGPLLLGGFMSLAKLSSIRGQCDSRSMSTVTGDL